MIRIVQTTAVALAATGLVLGFAASAAAGAQHSYF